MQHVDAQTPTPQDGKQIEGGRRGVPGHRGLLAPPHQPPQARRQPEQHDADPGQQRHVVFGGGPVGHQPDPIRQAGVEKRMAEQQRRGKAKQARGGEQPRPPSLPQTGPEMQGAAQQQQHQGHRVQDTETDVARAKDPPRPETDQRRAAGHLAPALPEAPPALPLRMRHGLAQAGAKQEQGDDERALGGPERVVVEVLRREAEIPQVKAKVEHHHPHHRRAAQGVQPLQALLPRASRRGGGSLLQRRHPKKRRALMNMRIHGLWALRSSGVQLISTLRKTRSGWGISAVKRPSAVVTEVSPSGLPFGLAG